MASDKFRAGDANVGELIKQLLVEQRITNLLLQQGLNVNVNLEAMRLDNALIDENFR